jgi:hypothetical protein
VTARRTKRKDVETAHQRPTALAQKRLTGTNPLPKS